MIKKIMLATVVMVTVMMTSTTVQAHQHQQQQQHGQSIVVRRTYPVLRAVTWPIRAVLCPRYVVVQPCQHCNRYHR